MSKITGRRRLIGPTDPVVTLVEMRGDGVSPGHLRLDATGSPPTHPEDGDIARYVQAATDALHDQDGDGWLGRALLPETWRITWDSFPESCPSNPDGALFLPYPPLIEVLAVTYKDTSGALVTMDPADYEVSLDGDPHGFIRPLYNTTWPITAWRQDAVSVTFRCGYDETASPSNPLPDAIKQYVIVLAALMYEHREANVANINLTPIANFEAAALRKRVRGP